MLQVHSLFGISQWSSIQISPRIQPVRFPYATLRLFQSSPSLSVRQTKHPSLQEAFRFLDLSNSKVGTSTILPRAIITTSLIRIHPISSQLTQHSLGSKSKTTPPQLPAIQSVGTAVGVTTRTRVLKPWPSCIAGNNEILCSDLMETEVHLHATVSLTILKGESIRGG